MTERINQKKLEQVIIEIKLSVNRNLFERGILTEEMYIKAKELILKSWQNMCIGI